jgi:hypothetical protein
MAIIRVNKPKMWIEQESEGDVYLYSDNGDIAMFIARMGKPIP